MQGMPGDKCSSRTSRHYCSSGLNGSGVAEWIVWVCVCGVSKLNIIINNFLC